MFYCEIFLSPWQVDLVDISLAYLRLQFNQFETKVWQTIDLLDSFSVLWNKCTKLHCHAKNLSSSDWRRTLLGISMQGHLYSNFLLLKKSVWASISFLGISMSGQGDFCVYSNSNFKKFQEILPGQLFSLMMSKSIAAIFMI